MSIYLGNLSIEEMEKRSGIEFPEGLKTLLKDTRQEKAKNVQKGKWHCFDIPFMLVCGDMELAHNVHNYLLPFSDSFDKPLHIGVSENQLPENY